MKYTQEEIDFLIENYPKYGSKYCQPFLKGRSLDAINAVAARNGLKCTNKVVHPDLQNVSISKFKPITTREVAYFLGYFWADGNIIKYESGGITHHRIAMEIVKTDADSISSIMSSIGRWAIQIRKRDSWKTTTTFTTSNKDLYEFLEENDYLDKSTAEPTRILSLIPDELQIYFWKGLLDGDGSIGSVGRDAWYLELASTHEYQYKEFEKWITSYTDKGSIYRQVSKRGHKSSVYKLYGRKIIPICNVIPDFGLERKTRKFKALIKRYE